MKINLLRFFCIECCNTVTLSCGLTQNGVGYQTKVTVVLKLQNSRKLLLRLVVDLSDG
jgi:hypothetical protein